MMISGFSFLWLASVHSMVASAGTGGATGPGATLDVSTSSTTQGSIEAINQFCNGLGPMTKEKERRRLFGLFQRDERDKGRWIEYRRERDLDLAAKEERVFDVAQVWSREDGATAVSMSFTSGSGDWFHLGAVPSSPVPLTDGNSAE